MNNCKADIHENALLSAGVLENLLSDTNNEGHNIIWFTDSYAELGSGYMPDDEITVGKITGKNNNVIMPRAIKAANVQLSRTKASAEVFTPSDICRLQVLECEKQMRNNGISPIDYINLKCIEITCGEGPYIAARYDTVTGAYIQPAGRNGMLDRKLKACSRIAKNADEWVRLATSAAQSVYGFELQGDSLLLAREAALMTICEHYAYKYGSEMPSEKACEITNIIAHNIFQMDGITLRSPTGHDCYVTNWNTNDKILFSDLLK